MKWRILLVSLLVIVVAVMLAGRPITEKILNQQLAPLLTDALGLPVTLKPISVNLLRLSASTDKLVMGDSKDPAVVAEKVWVRIGWTNLLRGEIRLVNVKAADLSVKVASWPSSNSPWPEDYFFLDQWIPKKLAVETGRYIYADSSTYPLTKLRWKRTLLGGSEADWQEERAGGPISVALQLRSLKDLLALTDFQTNITLASDNALSPELSIDLVIEAAKAGYALSAEASTDDWKLQFDAGNTRTWEWPDKSKTTLDQLTLESIGLVIGYLSRDNTQITVEEFLAEKLPQFQPIDHSGRLEIKKFSVDDETVTNTHIDFVSNQTSIEISSLVSAFPRGDLKATSMLLMSPDGWQLDSTAKLTARTEDVGIAAEYLDNDWLWHSGDAALKGQGGTWGGLLDSFGGNISLAGWHAGPERTPISINGRLNSSSSEFAIEALEIQMGEAKITGSAALKGGKERTLHLKLTAESMNLNFLSEGDSTIGEPGIKIPEYLGAVPSLDLRWDIALHNLEMPGLKLSSVQLKLDRGNSGGKLSADLVGTGGGSMGLDLDWLLKPSQAVDVTLAVALTNMDLRQLFDQNEGVLESQSTGKFEFSSQGNDVVSVFEGMRGNADLSIAIRTDGDWTRPAKQNEQVKLSGNPSLVIVGKQITGFEISSLNIDSISQDVTGTVSMVDNRQPWMIADLHSDQLSIPEILDLFPDTAEAADQADILESLRKFGTVKVSMSVGTLDWDDINLSKVVMEVDSDVDVFSIGKLDFQLEQGKFQSRAGLTWKGTTATLEASGKISKLGLEEFVHTAPANQTVPLVGTFSLQSEGDKFAELAAHITGSASLRAAPGTDQTKPEQRRELEMQIKRLSDGVEIELSKLLWGETDLQARVRYQNTSPPRFQVDVKGGTLSLTPWEESEPAKEEKTEKDDAGIVSKTATASASTVRRVLTAPYRLLGGNEATANSDRYFSDEPINLAPLKKYDLMVKGELASVQSTIGEAMDLKFDAVVNGGNLQLDASIGAINGGNIDLSVNYDASQETPTGKLTSTFNNLYASPAMDTYPRSGYVDVSSSGSSQAELAANLGGLAYLELGKGTMDYAGLTFLTSDVASSVFGALIPGAEKSKPEVQCGISLGQFKQGIGVTPYGYAVRTRRANLIGRMDVDFRKERIELQFDSRSRTGTGLSVGNVFSNTVRLQGPLTDPRIVPNTTALLWRGWAAVMTAGISVVGESVLKRALAAATPCENIREEIQQSLCTGDNPVDSALVCPKLLPVVGTQDTKQVEGTNSGKSD